MSQSTETESNEVSQSWSDKSWERVSTAIHQKWPHINSDDIRALPCDTDAVVGFLKEFTESPMEEIKSVVDEFAPREGFQQRVAAIAEEIAEDVAVPVQSAYERVQYEADEHPAAATGVVFVTGLALGILGTIAFYKARPNPARITLNDYLPNRWSR